MMQTLTIRYNSASVYAQSLVDKMRSSEEFEIKDTSFLSSAEDYPCQFTSAQVRQIGLKALKEAIDGNGTEHQIVKERLMKWQK